MKGADEYAELFETGQYGRFYVISGEHGRGRTFRIQLLPKNTKAIPNGRSNLCLNADAVEIYGMIDGHPGWTETYGWLYQGLWISDFERLVERKQQEKAAQQLARERDIEEIARTRKAREIRLLSEYVPESFSVSSEPVDDKITEEQAW